jgi:hypothetical protein
MPFENFREGIFPREKLFIIDETLKRHFLGAFRVV